MEDKKTIAQIRADFVRQLEETSTAIQKLNKEIEQLKVRQHQLTGGIFALDLVNQNKQEGESNG